MNRLRMIVRTGVLGSASTPLRDIPKSAIMIAMTAALLPHLLDDSRPLRYPAVMNKYHTLIAK